MANKLWQTQHQWGQRKRPKRHAPNKAQERWNDKGEINKGPTTNNGVRASSLEIHKRIVSKLGWLPCGHSYRQEHTESAVFQCAFLNFVHLLSPSVIQSFCVGQQNHLVLFVYIQDTCTFMSKCLGVYFCVLVSLLIFCSRIKNYHIVVFTSIILLIMKYQSCFSFSNRIL